MNNSRRREAVTVAIFAVLILALFSTKPAHIDEPFFLAIARQILKDPLHPFSFSYNWYGALVPMTTINNTPPLIDYLLAAAWAITGGKEWAMRLFFLPWDILSAVSLYLIAARFLSRPFWPAMIVIAAPAYMINLNHMMPERLVAGFAFPCFYALIKSIDEKRNWLYWVSAGCLALALISKYAAVFLLLPVFAYAWQNGVSFRRQAGYFAAAFTPLALYLAWQMFGNGQAAAAAWDVTSQAASMFWGAWPHKLRSFLAFAAGCSVVAIVWPYLAFSAKPARALAALAAAALFIPSWDPAPLVRPIDRWTGVIMACGAAWGMAGLFAEWRRPGAKLWLPWLLSVALVQIGLYWSVLARLVLFLVPPLVFALAEILESRRPSIIGKLYPVTFAAVLGLSLSLSIVDYRYAVAQKRAAREICEYFPGKRIWSVPHWGLQHYLEAAGAVEMDFAKGGWDLAKPGDVVVLARVNSNIYKPRRPIPAAVRSWTLDEKIPLRLISGWSGEGGFYSNVSGFLPYSLSREPLEEFTVLELR
jgi:4-amino-4-deoxy-L-arabinose transferase-like glycosyltransferase